MPNNSLEKNNKKYKPRKIVHDLSDFTKDLQEEHSSIYYVAYIDILGTKKIVENDKNDIYLNNLKYAVNNVSDKTNKLTKIKNELIENNLLICDKNIDKLIEELKLTNENELYIGIGSGKFTASSIVKMLTKKELPKKDIVEKINETTFKKEISKNDILVEGIGEIKVTISNCCKPIPGDNIIGYITKCSGITVHRSNCKNIIDLDERLVNVKWNNNVVHKYLTDIIVYTNTSDNLLDIIAKASTNGITIDSISTINKSEYKVYNMTVLVENKEKLDKYIVDLQNLSFIKKVERYIN